MCAASRFKTLFAILVEKSALLAVGSLMSAKTEA